MDKTFMIVGTPSLVFGGVKLAPVCNGTGKEMLE